MLRILLIVILLNFVVFAFEANLHTPVSHLGELNAIKLNLGKRLFNDPLLSKDGSISCLSCHEGESFGVDNRKTAIGIDKQEGNINAPTTFNSGFNFFQFHDGRAKTLQEQAKGPIANPIEMGNNFENVVKEVKKNNHYIIEFNRLYKDGITIDNIVDVIAYFEKALITPSRFDNYLKGDQNALREVEKEGYALFKSYGCIACHNGKNLGGNLLQRLGIFKDYNGTSLGRYNVTKNEDDKNVFKVPTLRNIAWTQPYLHDGSLGTLEKTIRFMGEYQLGVDIPQEDIKKIEEFLYSLSGELADELKN